MDSVSKLKERKVITVFFFPSKKLKGLCQTPLIFIFLISLLSMVSIKPWQVGEDINQFVNLDYLELFQTLQAIKAYKSQKHK